MQKRKRSPWCGNQMALCSILLVCFTPAFSWGLDLLLNSKMVRQGEVFTLEARLQNASGLGHLLFDVVYPAESVTLTQITPGPVALTVDENSRAAYATSPELFPADQGRMRFGWLFGAGYDGAGDVLTLHFKMGSEDVRELPIKLESSVAVGASASLEDQTVIEHEGQITVQWYGDVNNDGQLDASDAITILHHIVGVQTLSAEMQEIADVSGGYGITAYDAALVYRKITGLIDTFPVLEESTVAAPVFASTQHALHIGEPQITNDKVTVPLELLGPEDVFSTEFHIGYDPKALSFVRARPGAILKARRLVTNHEAGEIVLSFADAASLEEAGTFVQLEFRVREGRVEESALVLQRVLFNEELSIPMENRALTFIPTETKLLPNYPNPFNPETWIPYQLAADADVLLRIYDAQGHLVRELDLGYQRKGYYVSRARSVHWDGRNSSYERVASGLYVYQMLVGERAFTRKLVVLK